MTRPTNKSSASARKRAELSAETSAVHLSETEDSPTAANTAAANINAMLVPERRTSPARAAKKTPLKTPLTHDCVWSKHLGKACSPTLPPPKKCSKSGCRNMIHHLCMINWEESQGYEGPLQTVCPSHHTFFMSIGGGGKAKASQTSVPTVPMMDGLDELDNVSFSGDGFNLGGDASVAEGASEGDDDFGISEFTTEQFEVNERCSYFMNRVPISNDNRAAVEAVYMIEAITIVRSGNTLRKPEQATKIMATYKGLIANIPDNRFGNCKLKDDMLTGYFRAKTGSASGLQGKIESVKSIVSRIVRELKLSKLPSGCGIHDVKDRWIRDRFVEVTGQHASELQDGWWISNERIGKTESKLDRVPCIYILAALVHKDNPDLVVDPTLVPASGTRDDIRMQMSKAREKEKVVQKMASVTARGKLDDSMMRTKAKLMEQNIDLQETEGIEKQLNLMDRFKSSFVNVYGELNEINGQREYDMAVCDLLHELPYMKKRKLAQKDK